MSEDPKVNKVLEKDLDTEVNDSEDVEEYDSDSDDLCKGCHWCDPESYPEKPPTIPLPEGHFISIHFMTKQDLRIEEWKYKTSKLFTSYESATKGILNFYKETDYDKCDEDEYDEDEYDEDECDNEKPPINWACQKYNPIALSGYGQGEEINLFDRYDDIHEFCRTYPIFFFYIIKPE